LSPEHSRCAQRGERVRAQFTDHIVPLRDGGARLDPCNHQSLCFRCNTAKR
jgi:5-methylcytosine-specific restriction endonuclease McrA